MNRQLSIPLFKKVLFILFLSTLSAFAQKNDSLKKSEPLRASANIQVTNNGVSLFPNLMLGKPAAIINLTVGKKHIFFEPELRWRLNGEPWSYIFWLRYRPKRTEHFSWHVGAHPSYVVRPNQVVVNGKTENRWVAQRFLAAEFVPVWHYSPKFALGLHILGSKGLDKNYGVQKSSYVSLQPRFPHIGISKEYYLGFFPQVFHLTLDQTQGTYYSQMLSINKMNLPFYLSTIFTYKLKGNIPGDNIVWNIGLNVKL
ncbi:hypothetical protein Emtol_2219 [Emticicia oligotrophica DSM 17448]|jgi:hypothetical protein|uniref:DUF3575 domain-containing protein n=1 Tax=Emticicia oligotrophica (strain DSM 17448 / CIP 109782 / MTCC 6937 / GPTSA100-15) TaxID=929562 RepID=A0ABM5N1R5_EMTOG|nr:MULTISPECIES: hypothetical protein [Emticicia]AFK03357.1 hypothetical protein Emtol_2219 [Emticicia oligotrophica DSM 17448]